MAKTMETTRETFAALRSLKLPVPIMVENFWPALSGNRTRLDTEIFPSSKWAVIIPQVKQHLRRTHYTKNHCCERRKTVFVDNAPYQAHLRQQCTFKEVDVPEWISHQTRLALAKKSKPQHSESEKWFEIWGLLFPGTPPPSSAYIDHNLSEDLCELRSYAHDHGPRVLREELKRVGVRFDMDSSESREEVISAAIRRGEEQLLEAWLYSRSLPPEGSNKSPKTGISVQMCWEVICLVRLKSTTR